jgi:translation initiation factor 2B subunit (eIF-2B alpha/beta/delta family)
MEGRPDGTGHTLLVLTMTCCLLCQPQNINFSVYVTEGRPDGTGQTMARELDKLGVPVTMVLDSGVAYALER